MRRILLLALLLAIILAGTFVATGTSLIPTSVTLGPCLKDYSSPLSYQPRQSPLATVRFGLGDAEVELCYGRPVARGRTIFGALVPYDSLWRLGANEPTRLYLNRPITFAGIPLAAGRYSLYARPEADRWTLFVSRSTQHWGNDISREVRAREVGQVVLPVETLSQPVETLTVRLDGDPGSGHARLVVSWERTAVTMELERAGIPHNLGVVP